MRATGLALMLLLACMCLAPGAVAGPRVALVIGNSAYGGEIGALANPGNDAALIAAALGDVGFEVDTVVDADLRRMKRAISDFGRRLVEAGPEAVGLFYYAGHGVQIGGANYLVPLGAAIASEADVEMEAVDADWILNQMEYAGNRVNIVILDACRNNPLARSMRSAMSGLARMDAPRGSFIAYSTAPGEVALDGSGGNSPYAESLARAIRAGGVPIEEMFRNVRVDVMAKTGDRQVPWDSSSLTGAFFFREPVATATAAAAPASPVTAQAAGDAVRGQAGPGGPAAGDRFRDCPDCPEMVVLPPGRFVMGAPAEDEDRQKDETPVHKVNIAAPFALSTTEITRDQFAAFVSDTGRDMGGDCYLADGGEGRSDEHAGWLAPGFSQDGAEPVVCVTWRDAEAYVEWLGNRTGKGYRLPTEAEWEYAARAGRSGFVPWDNALPGQSCAVANGIDTTGHAAFPTLEAAPCDDRRAFTAPVGSYAANRFGLFDMAGNAWEWVADCYVPDYRGAPGDGSAVITDPCGQHPTRGGSWIDGPWDLRFARRYPLGDDDRENIVGFRVARDIP